MSLDLWFVYCDIFHWLLKAGEMPDWKNKAYQEQLAVLNVTDK
jgi:hypothetical protein